MNILFVGDPHAQVSDLDDCQSLVNYAKELAIKNNATLFLSGDLFHTHLLVRGEVLLFWYNFFESLKGHPCICIAGNHDQGVGQNSLATPMLAHSKQVTTVLYDPYVNGNVLFCPYTFDPHKLVQWSRQHPECNTLFCHQTFKGVGFTEFVDVKDAVDPADIVQKMIISGHIHSSMIFGKVFYPGSPRWLTLSDANQDKAIWLFRFDPEGNLIEKDSFDTSTICTKIFHFVDTPETPVSFTPVPNAKYRVDIKGPEDWVIKRLPLFEGVAKVRRLVTKSSKNIQIKESEGVGIAFDRWLGDFRPRHSTSTETLKRMVVERGLIF